MLPRPHTAPLPRPQWESYSVIFPAGLPGEFFSWFIQLHEGFPQIKNMDMRYHPTDPYDAKNDGKDPIGHQGRSWNPETITHSNKFGDKWVTEKGNFKDSIGAMLEQGYGDFTKMVFRINPNHYLNYVHDQFDMVHTNDSNIVQHIVLEIGDIDVRDMIEVANPHKTKWDYTITPGAGFRLGRRDLVTAEWVGPKFESFYDSFVYYKERIELKGVKVDRVDVGQLFQRDVYEYYKLLKIIDCPPIENWRTIIKEYTDLCFFECFD